jgi:hypothetical protein
MLSTQKRTPQVEEVRSYVEGVAKNLVDQLYGPEGPPWGTTLTELEEMCLAVRAVLTEKLLDVALERQAAAHPQRPLGFRTCPACQPPLDCADTEPRVVQTRTGEAEWLEPQAYCRTCRQSFFPSVQEPGP